MHKMNYLFELNIPVPAQSSSHSANHQLYHDEKIIKNINADITEATKQNDLNVNEPFKYTKQQFCLSLE